MPFITPGAGRSSKPGYMSPQLQPEAMNMNEGGRQAKIITGQRQGSNSNRSSEVNSSKLRAGIRRAAKLRSNSKDGGRGFIPPSLRVSITSSQDPTSGNIDRGNFFDDRNGAPVTFSTPLTNKLYPQSKRINSVDELRLFIQYGQFNIISDQMTGIAKDAALAVFAKLKLFVNKEVRNSAWTTFTLDNFNAYLVSVYNAVCLYYAVDAILSFGPSGNQYNLNIEAVRNTLADNVNILSEQSRLRRAIRGHYLPSNMFKLVHKFCQFHRCSELEDSSAFTFDLARLWSRNNNGTLQPQMYDNTWLTNKYDSVIGALNSNDNLQKVGVISQVFPGWEINDLPLSSNHAQWDISAFNFFRNIRYQYKLKDAAGVYTTYPSDTGIVNQFYSVTTDPNQLDGYIESFLAFGPAQAVTNNNNGIFKILCSADSIAQPQFDASRAYFLGTTSNTGYLSMVQSPKDIAQSGTVHNVDFGYSGNNTAKVAEFSVNRCEDQRVFALNQEGTEFNTRSFVEFMFE